MCIQVHDSGQCQCKQDQHYTKAVSPSCNHPNGDWWPVLSTGRRDAERAWPKAALARSLLKYHNHIIHYIVLSQWIAQTVIAQNYCNNFQFSVCDTRLRKHYHSIPCTITEQCTHKWSGLCGVRLCCRERPTHQATTSVWESAVYWCTCPLGITLLQCTGCVGPSFTHLLILLALKYHALAVNAHCH